MALQPGGKWDPLHDLGLRREWINEELGAGNLERTRCASRHSSRSAPGFYAYNGVLTSLSEQLCATAEWVRDDPMSMPLLTNSNRRIALAVTSGDRMTGLRDSKEQPRTRNPKGELTLALIGLNKCRTHQDQLALFAPPEQNQPLRLLVERFQEYQFWYLLVYFDKQLKEIRSEVSKPCDANTKGIINNWQQPRHIMPPYNIELNDFDPDDDPNEGFGDDDPTANPR